MANARKWIMISYLFLAGLVGLFFFYAGDLVWDAARLPSPHDWFVTLPQIIAFVLASAAFVILQRHPKINEFANEVATELAKVTWPERKETLLSAGVIIVMLAVCAMILFGFDSLWGTMVRFVY